MSQPAKDAQSKPTLHNDKKEDLEKEPPPTESYRRYRNLDKIKQKRRYRNSISTESPIVMLTPPNAEEARNEERRLSNASIHSTASTSNQKDDNENHLVPPAEPEPEEIVARLISQRRPSTITTLSSIIKQIFIDKKVKEDGIPSLVIDGIYLGSIGAAKNLQWLKTKGVTHVLCVAGGIGACYPKQFIYKVVDINDAPNEDITAHFISCYQFIETCLKANGKVLVHCFAGMSRSVTVVSAYLMQKRRMYAVPALKFVKSKRSIANPNAGFIVQLIKYQKVLGMRRKNSLDLPSSSGDESSHSHEDVYEDEDDGKAAQPKVKSLKSLAFAVKNNKKSNKNNELDSPSKSESLTIKLSPIVKEWESGRRPSLFTALDRLRGMKLRHRRVGSTESNISAMSDKDNGLPPPAAPVPTPPDQLSGLTPVALAKLQLLKEASNETDVTDHLSPVNKRKFDHIKVETVRDDEDDVITPLETLNDETFPDTTDNILDI